MRAFTAALDLRRYVGRWSLRSASHAGRFFFMLLDLVRGILEWRVWLPRTLEQTVSVGYGAELGSMRVTEQIDALESLGRSPVTHLLLPRILAGLIAIPALVMLANAFGIVVGFITAKSSLGLTYADFEFGARYFFRPLDLWYSLVKSYAFAGAVTIIPCYIGFNTQQGAEGVGRSTTQAVVSSSVTILMLDTILTKLILGTAK